MPAYIIANVDWTHPDAMEEYGKLAYPTLVAAGGKSWLLRSSQKLSKGIGGEEL